MRKKNSETKNVSDFLHSDLSFSLKSRIVIHFHPNIEQILLSI